MGAPTSYSTRPKQPKCNYFNEQVYARRGGQKFPSQFPHNRNDDGTSNARSKWSAADIIAELQHKKANAPHVHREQSPDLPPLPGPRPAPRSCYGLDIHELDDWFDDLVERSKKLREPPYQRAGKWITQSQRDTIPILLVAIASYPDPVDFADRVKLAMFEQSVIRAAEDRYGSTLVSVIEHLDEGFPHFHIVVADEGRPVKLIHNGFKAQKAAERAGVTKRKELQEIFLAGCVAVQDWFAEAVGNLMGWQRKSKTPKKKKGHAAQVAYNVRIVEDGKADIEEKIEEMERSRLRRAKYDEGQDARIAEQVAHNALEKERLNEEKAALDAARKVLADAKALVDAKHADATRKLLMSQTSERAADISRQVDQDLWAALPPKVRREAEANLELLKDYKARGI